MTTIARHLSISGRVQGVFYRDWAIHTARTLGVTGWVRNRPDGSVEALAIGEPVAVEAFIARCRSGSPSSRVDDVIMRDAAVEAVDGFERRPTG